jgi:hypothetical protein
LIPRTFHHVWLGPDPLPPVFARFRETWATHHPDWELRLWTEDALPENLVRTEVYDTRRIPSERSSILRYEILFRYGGIYLDTDFECQRALGELVDGLDFFTAYLSDGKDGRGGRIGAGIIGAVAGHPILEKATNEARGGSYEKRDKALSGTVFFSRVVSGFPEARIFDRPIFYPRTRSETSNAYAVHHFARSWKTPDELRESLNRTEVRLAEAKEEILRLRAELAAARSTPLSRLRRRLVLAARRRLR